MTLLLKINNLLKALHKLLAKRLLKKIGNFESSCEESGYLDEQWYLDFQDALNAFSIDKDREDYDKTTC